MARAAPSPSPSIASGDGSDLREVCPATFVPPSASLRDTAARCPYHENIARHKLICLGQQVAHAVRLNIRRCKLDSICATWAWNWRSCWVTAADASLQRMILTHRSVSTTPKAKPPAHSRRNSRFFCGASWRRSRRSCIQCPARGNHPNTPPTAPARGRYATAI